MIPEDKHQRLKRLYKLSSNGDAGQDKPRRQAEMRNGLRWAVKEIRELEKICLYQRKQNAALSMTIKMMAPKLFGKGEDKDKDNNDR